MKTNIDLFEHYDELPLKIKEIIHNFNTKSNTYETCKELVSELEIHGYTCEYGLDAEPHSLRKLEATNETPEDMNYNITEQGDNFFINGIEIPNEIFEQEKTDFKIVDRENFIDDLINWISECKNSDRDLMKSDLKDLIKIDDEFILSSIDTNYYLHSNSEEFNNKCKEILNLVNA